MADPIKLALDSIRNMALVGQALKLTRQLMLAALIVLTMPLAALAEEDKGLIFTSEGEAFREAVNGIIGDLEEDLSFVTVTLTKDSKASDIAKQIKKHQPKVIVLIENNSVKLYGAYQKANPEADFPPSVALAALFVDRFLKNIKNATGIRYEIPAVTSIVNMRSVVSKEIRKVGVVHRAWMKGMIEQNAKYCAAEGIELVSVSIPNKDSKLDQKLKSGLKSLIDKGVDALWVINDNALLNGKMIRGAWIPVVGKAKLPVIVGIEPLLNTKLNFGSFAIVPDHYALGVQAASIIGEIMEEDWEIGDRDLEQPVSVKKIVNTKVLEKKKVKYSKESLNAMDKVVNQ